MSPPVELHFHVLDAAHFVQVDAAGRINVAASIRMAQEIAAFDGPGAKLPLLLDARALSGALSVLDTVELVKTLAAERARYRRKLALLVRDDAQLERARFLETYSVNRGIPIAAFTDYDQAVKWLGEP